MKNDKTKVSLIFHGEKTEQRIDFDSLEHFDKIVKEVNKLLKKKPKAKKYELNFFPPLRERGEISNGYSYQIYRNEWRSNIYSA